MNASGSNDWINASSTGFSESAPGGRPWRSRDSETSTCSPTHLPCSGRRYVCHWPSEYCLIAAALTRACREQTNALTQCQAAERLAEQELAGIERDAGKAALKAEELAHRFGLTGEVPCAGTDMQGQCKLLGDAREARALIPSAKAQIARLAREEAIAKSDLAAASQQHQVLAGAPQALVWAEPREVIARNRAGGWQCWPRKRRRASKRERCWPTSNRNWPRWARTERAAAVPRRPKNGPSASRSPRREQQSRGSRSSKPDS